MSWEIYHGGEWKTFSALGLSNPTRGINSQMVDVVGFHAAQDFDADLLFAYGATVQIRRDGVQWFYGRVTKTPRMGAPRLEEVGYEVSGPWFWLDHLVFQQTWNYADAFGVTQSGKSSHLMLGQKLILDPEMTGNLVGVPQTTAEQISEVLAWAVACGAPLQAGTILTGITVPIREIRDTTCGEAIRQMLRWHPDAVTWFDYSTTPPTFHCGKRANLQVINLTVGETPIQSVSIASRDDLKVPAVVLKFESTDTSQPDGIARQRITTQIAPLGASEDVLGAMVATVDLQGASANWLRAVTTTGTIDAASTNETLKKAWWAAKLPWLNDARVVSFTVSDVARSGAHGYARELVDGQITEWMIEQGLNQEDEEISAKVSVTYANASSKNNTVSEVQTVRVKATDAPLGEQEYVSLQSYASGEAEPTGLAQAVYDALATLQYEGSVVLKEEEVNTAMRAAGITNSAGVGCVLNIAGGRSEWAAMKALVVSVIENLSIGETTINYGPAGHLGYGDLIELLQINRNRFNYTAPVARTDPSSAARGELGLGKHLPKGQANSGAQAYSEFWVLNGSRSAQLNTTASAATLEVKETTTSNKTVKLESTTTGALLHITDGTNTAQIDIADALAAISTIGGSCGVIKIRAAEYCKDNVAYDTVFVMAQLRPKGGGTLIDPV